MVPKSHLPNRREFLKRMAAVLSAPYVIPSRVLGRDGAVAPSERINMGFVGLGGQGAGHLLGGSWTYVPGGYVAREDVQVLAVCDVRKERRDRAQQRCNEVYAAKTGQAGYNGVQAYNDFRELLARPDIDAVLLALPYHWAGLMATMAVRAGKDVYCEKPICATIHEGRNLVETVKRYGRVYQAGTQQRSEYSGRFRLACELVRNGRIGQLKEVYAYRQPGTFFPTTWSAEGSQPVPEGFDWDLWLGPLPWRPYAGQAGHTIPGLYIGDFNWSPHHYDIIQWTLGADRTGPLEASWGKPVEKGSGGSAYPSGAQGRPEQGEVVYQYANGVRVHSRGYPGEPVGGEGGACFVGTEGRIAVDRSNIVSYPASILKEPIRPTDTHVYRCSSHSGNFLECIRTRRAPICDVETGVRTISAITVGGIAMALQRSVKWDPVKEQFIGDDEANRLLSYTPRAPWRL